MIAIEEGKYYIDNKSNIWTALKNGAMSVHRRVDRGFAYPIRMVDGNTLKGSPNYTIVGEWVNNPWAKDSTYHSNFEFIRSLKVGDILRNRADGSLWGVKRIALIELAFIHIVALKGGDCPQKVLHCTCSELGFMELVNISACIGSSVDPEYRMLIEEYVSILNADPRIEKFHNYIAVDPSGGFNTFMQEPRYDIMKEQWVTEDGMFRYVQCNSTYRNVSRISKCKISDIRFTAEVIKQNKNCDNVFEFGLDDGTHLKITIERVSNVNN